MRLHNFSPGPAVLPISVLAEASESLLEYQHRGMSFAEMSHRSAPVMDVVEEATALVKELLGTKDNFEVIWVPGGASSQLAVAPMNLVSPTGTFGYVKTGFWADRAIDAGRQICKVKVLASAEDSKFDHIPKSWQAPKDLDFLHLVSNETIDGVQYHEFPDVSVPLVSDMTSDLFTRPLPVDKFGVIFASAQKNFGISGCTCVLIRKDILTRKVNRLVPTIFDYKTHIETHSLYHTAPTFPIYTSMLMLRWIKEQGGLVAIDLKNREKANLLYEEIDRNPLFSASIVQEDRSVMNACFRINKADLEAPFLKYAESLGIVGIKGFPTVGGFRASIYNAQPKESVELLVKAMRDFEINNTTHNSKKSSVVWTS
jgi:phosphoserine aminotransferase